MYMSRIGVPISLRLTLPRIVGVPRIVGRFRGGTDNVRTVELED